MFEDEGNTELEVASLIGVGGGERRTTPYVGTKALMLAVLEDGIRAYLSHGTERYEAELWVHGRGRGSAFSFVVICETLGLEPQPVRSALSRLRERHAAIFRSRPKVRRYASLRRRGTKPV
jgi:hypothetical protein